MTAPGDRTVHCTIISIDGRRIEYVRYGRSGKWWREGGDRRTPIKLADAVAIASLVLPGIFWHEGLPGGQQFDAKVRRARGGRR